MKKHTEHIRYDKYNPLPDVPVSMTAEELALHWSRLLTKVPIRGGGKKLQELYDHDLKHLTYRNMGYSEELHIRNLKQYLTGRTTLYEQIRAGVLLGFLNNMLTLPELALIMYYNGDRILKKGKEALYKEYNKYSKLSNRTGCSEKELPHQIKRLEKILKSSLLKESAKPTVISELKTLTDRQ
jgi:hypothetical protein